MYLEISLKSIFNEIQNQKVFPICTQNCLQNCPKTFYQKIIPKIVPKNCPENCPKNCPKCRRQIGKKNHPIWYKIMY